MMNFDRLLPVVGVGNYMFSSRYSAHGFCIVVHEKKSCAVAGRGFDFDNVRENFLNYLIPVHNGLSVWSKRPNVI